MSNKVNKPESDAEVLEVMRKYCEKKGYNFSNTYLDYMAQSCYLTYESKGWAGIKYWPPLAMKWVLNNLDKQLKHDYKPKLSKGKSVRDKIMESEAEQENE